MVAIYGTYGISAMIIGLVLISLFNKEQTKNK